MAQITKRVLIIEDDLLLLKALADKFSKEGFIVLQATDGEQGLATALKEIPDVILLDILMPKKDGMQMLHELRAANAWGAVVPVVILTNISSNDRVIESVMNDKAVYFFVKSNINLAEVVEKVKEIFEKPIS